MFWFLPLLFGAGLGFATAWAIDKYVIPYLNRDNLRRRLRNHSKMDVHKEINNHISKSLKNRNYNEYNMGLFALEDSETERVFAGTYYDGEVQSIEEIEYEEIESDLKRRLDREEIVIL